MFCSQCGNSVTEGSKFCPFCGNSMDFARQMTGNQGMFTIEREKSLSGALTAFHITIDGQQEIKLENGQKRNVPMEAGKHIIDAQFLYNHKKVEITYPEQSFIKFRLNKLTGMVEVVNQNGTILEKETGCEKEAVGQTRETSGLGEKVANREEKVTSALSGIGGMLKQAVAATQNTIQTAIANSEAHKGIVQCIKCYVNELENDALFAMLRLFATNGPEKVLVPYIKSIAKAEPDSVQAVLGEQSDETCCRAILLPLFEKILACDGFDQYWNEEQGADRRIQTMCKDIWEAMVKENEIRMKAKLIYKSSIKEVLEKVGLQDFYLPEIKYYVAMFQTKIPHVQEYVEQYDQNTIAEVRKWYAQIQIKDFLKENDLEADAREIYLADSNKTPLVIVRKGNELYFIANDSSKIHSKENLGQLLQNLIKKVSLADILYFKEEGEYHRDLKISGGGTNLLYSQSTLSRGNWTDKIKSETVVTDTRTICLAMKKESIRIAFECYETLKQMIPEKEYDVVDAIRKNKIIKSQVDGL